MYSYYSGLPIFWTLPVVQYTKITQRSGSWTCPRYQVKCKETSPQKGPFGESSFKSRDMSDEIQLSTCLPTLSSED